MVQHKLTILNENYCQRAKLSFVQKIKENPDQANELLGYFVQRLRNMDEQAMMQAFAPQTVRVQFELKGLWDSALPDRRSSDIQIAKVGLKQTARSAHVHLEEVMSSLESDSTGLI